MSAPSIYRAKVRNHAQLAYNAVGAWLDGKGPAPSKVAASKELQDQLRLQDEAARKLRAARFRLGALNFDRIEAHAVVADGGRRRLCAAAMDAGCVAALPTGQAERRTRSGERGGNG